MSERTACSWICAQQGAREHYAIPRALASIGRLRQLITDVWIQDKSWLRRLPLSAARGLVARSHDSLAGERITAFNSAFLRMDLGQWLRPRTDESFYTSRNERFDRLACAVLEHELTERPAGELGIVFAYAHACRNMFKLARQYGSRTVLGQFDPGPVEADIVEQEHAAYPHFRSTSQRYSAEYVQRWRDEVNEADTILVNSTWSRDCLDRVGVAVAKIAIVPLAYSPERSFEFERHYPSAFTRARPLRVLFLGQIILRKGIARLFEAADLLKGAPIDIHLVGPTDIENLEELVLGLPIQLHGCVPRSEVARHYREADVFVLPTLSDGFAITQIEAQAWRLPVVTTNRCGDVIHNGVNGIVLSDPTADSIADSLKRLVGNPELLAGMSQHSSSDNFGLDRLSERLCELERRLEQAS